jgi:hypothetical protein
MIDTRYIYIGRTTSNKRLVKIGIAANPRKRWQQINSSIKGSTEYPVAYFRVLNAKKLETALHRKYKLKQRRYKGSGATEWFALGFFARLWLYIIIAAHGMLMVLLIVAGVFSILLTLIVLI